MADFNDNTSSELLEKFKNEDLDIDNKNFEKIKELISEEKNLKICNHRKETLLHLACRSKYTEIVKILIGKGLEINKPDKYGYTPLMNASREGEIESVKLLLKANADINFKGRTNGTALIYACHNQVSNILIKLLLDNGANPNIVSKMIGYPETPLLSAIRSNNISLVKLLLSYGANPIMKNEYGYEPIFEACILNDTNISELLIKDYNVNINVNTLNTKRSPLHYASLHNSVDNVKYLLKNGADIKQIDSDGNNVLCNACWSGNYETVSILLNDKNININERCDKGKTALYYACEFCYENIVKILLENGANPNIYTLEGDTALFQALYKKKKNIINMIIDANVDLNMINYKKDNALILACKYKFTDIAKKLISLGINIHHRNMTGVSVWKYATYDNELVQILEDNKLEKTEMDIKEPENMFLNLDGGDY